MGGWVEGKEMGGSCLHAQEGGWISFFSFPPSSFLPSFPEMVGFLGGVHSYHSRRRVCCTRWVGGWVGERVGGKKERRCQGLLGTHKRGWSPFPSFLPPSFLPSFPEMVGLLGGVHS